MNKLAYFVSPEDKEQYNNVLRDYEVEVGQVEGYTLLLYSFNPEVELSEEDLEQSREHVTNLLKGWGYNVFTTNKFGEHSEAHRTYKLSDTVTLGVSYFVPEGEEYSREELDAKLDEEVRKVGFNPEELEESEE